MIAFVRDVSPRLNQCELKHVPRAAIDAKRGRAQHAEFANTLKALGATVRFVPALPEQPDGVFVEDAAVILSETIVIARPGAASRQPEIETVAATLAEYRPVVRISGAATLDGGDVLRIGRTLFVGRSARTNAEGIAALAETVEHFGYDVQPVEVRDCLHLKSACTFIPPHFLLVNPAWMDLKPFTGLDVIEVDKAEPFAANTFTLAGTTLVSAAFPRTGQRLHEAGISTRRVDVSEFHKAEAGLSCLCLLLEPRAVRTADAPAGLRFVRRADRGPADCFSPAIVHGGLVYVSGQLPVDSVTGRPIEGDVEAQTERALRNLGEVLAASGSSLARLLKLTFYVADLKIAERVKPVFLRVCGRHRPTGLFVPTKTLEAGCLVAVDAIAAIADD